MDINDSPLESLADAQAAAHYEFSNYTIREKCELLNESLKGVCKELTPRVEYVSTTRAPTGGPHSLLYRDERVPLTPCVVYSGHNLEQAEFLHLCVDKERLFMVKNAEEGVIAIMRLTPTLPGVTQVKGEATPPLSETGHQG
ncbi:hypothetical protein HPB49_003089 [Dermacentor silvarum]|uniref:Uncharacterized protein n=1 Tax=Dermacentor silvarum TaxID=543639 RepID=A0ACB8DML8_DERSI|nr:hypothetical protein HPB49_003089 [Dermacentor silvarum]